MAKITLRKIKWRRVLWIVLLGVIINFTINLFMDLVFNPTDITLTPWIPEYISAIIITFIAFEGISIINRHLNKRIKWEQNAIKRFFVQIFLNFTYLLIIANSLGIFSTIFISGATYFGIEDLLIINGVVLIFGLIYVLVELLSYFYRKWKESLTRIEKFEKEKIIRTTEKQDKLSDNLQKSDIKQPPESENKFKRRFLIKSGDKYYYCETKDIAYCYAQGNIVFLISKRNKKSVVDYTIQELENLLNPKDFYRVTRKYIISLSSLEKAVKYFGGRLKILLIPQTEDEIIISRAKVPGFLDWLEGRNIL